MITMTEKAKKKVLDLIQAKADSGAFLRIGVKGGGCSGFSYVVEIDDKMVEFDKAYGEYPTKVVCDQKSFVYLNGMELDYSDSLVGGGFEFKNPNASGSCGCGKSFSV